MPIVYSVLSVETLLCFLFVLMLRWAVQNVRMLECYRPHIVDIPFECVPIYFVAVYRSSLGIY